MRVVSGEPSKNKDRKAKGEKILSKLHVTCCSQWLIGKQGGTGITENIYSKGCGILKMSEVLFSCMANGEELQGEQKGYFAQFLCTATDGEMEA